MSEDSTSQDELPQESEAPQPREVPQADGSRSRIEAFFSQPLTRIQALVGVCAGLISISGSVISVVGLAHHASAHGEMIALIQDTRLKKPVAAATIEILTSQNAVVTTLTVPDDGRVARRLKEGKYRVRVSHPQFISEVRQIEVNAGERSEIRVGLAPRAHAPVTATTHTTPTEPAAPVSLTTPRPAAPVAVTTPRPATPAPKHGPVAAQTEPVKKAESVRKAESVKKTESVKKAAEPVFARPSQSRESP